MTMIRCISPLISVGEVLIIDERHSAVPFKIVTSYMLIALSCGMVVRVFFFVTLVVRVFSSSFFIYFMMTAIFLVSDILLGSVDNPCTHIFLKKMYFYHEHVLFATPLLPVNFTNTTI